MSVSEALKTTFKGDHPTTQVIIPLVVAEADHGTPFATDEDFAGWIDGNSDRIYASAAAKRETGTLYESITLSPGDLLPEAPDDVPTLAVISTDDQEETRVIAHGEAPDGLDPLFIGHIHDAIRYVFSIPVVHRDALLIWTSGRVYGPEEFENMRRESGVS